MAVVCLVIETAFSNRERDLARRSLHLSPETLAKELEQIRATNRYPIYITHTKPSETGLIMNEIRQFDGEMPSNQAEADDIRWLRAGQVLDV